MRLKKKKETQMKIESRVCVDQPSNNWAMLIIIDN